KQRYGLLQQAQGQNPGFLNAHPALQQRINQRIAGGDQRLQNFFNSGGQFQQPGRGAPQPPPAQPRPPTMIGQPAPPQTMGQVGGNMYGQQGVGGPSAGNFAGQYGGGGPSAGNFAGQYGGGDLGGQAPGTYQGWGQAGSMLGNMGAQQLPNMGVNPGM